MEMKSKTGDGMTEIPMSPQGADPRAPAMNMVEPPGKKPFDMYMHC
jgi:hypothetical protein